MSWQLKVSADNIHVRQEYVETAVRSEPVDPLPSFRSWILSDRLNAASPKSLEQCTSTPHTRSNSQTIQPTYLSISTFSIAANPAPRLRLLLLCSRLCRLPCPYPHPSYAVYTNLGLLALPLDPKIRNPWTLRSSCMIGISASPNYAGWNMDSRVLSHRPPRIPPTFQPVGTAMISPVPDPVSITSRLGGTATVIAGTIPPDISHNRHRIAANIGTSQSDYHRMNVTKFRPIDKMGFEAQDGFRSRCRDSAIAKTTRALGFCRFQNGRHQT